MNNGTSTLNQVLGSIPAQMWCPAESLWVFMEFSISQVQHQAAGIQEHTVQRSCNLQGMRTREDD